MGLIERILGLIFGNGRNAVKDTVEVFRENAEGAGRREAERRAQALGQFGGEFDAPARGRFDRVMDALNRLPRPALAFGTLGMFVAAMVDPVWFAARMQGIALVPEPLWWLLGAIVSFYFGARHQAKGQDFQRQITRTLASVPQVVDNLATLETLERGAGRGEARGARPGAAEIGDDSPAQSDSMTPAPNPALRAWHRGSDFGR